jgi:RNA methyltransferase, TrmH family
VQEGPLIARFGRARRDPSLAVLEGFHPLKHALRFGANVLLVASRDVAELERLADRLAPELAARIAELAQPVTPSVFEQLAPLPPNTGVIALAERRTVAPSAILADLREAPVVLLEDPRDLGNMGACVRVAAAADAAGVLSTGSHDPWAPDALRGAAGLHFALPVARLSALDELGVAGGLLESGDLGPAGTRDASSAPLAQARPLLALDPDGTPLLARELPPRAVLAFGTERYGVSDELLARADARVSIPMRTGVSSLNLATSVAAVLFAWRLTGTAAR